MSDLFETAKSIMEAYAAGMRQGAELPKPNEDLLIACKAALAALSQHTTTTADINAAKKWLSDAIAMVEPKSGMEKLGDAIDGIRGDLKEIAEGGKNDID